MKATGRKYVLLDRDGTIIVNKHYQKDPGLTELLPGAKEALEMLRREGYGLVLISNQSGIGRGLLTPEDLAAVNRSMVDLLGGQDGELFDAMYHCPHIDADGCRCRKPRPGMLEAAAADLGFQLRAAWMIGDSAADIQAGQAAGTRTILVRTGNGAKTEAGGTVRPDYVADDLLSGVRWLLGGRRADRERE